MKFITRLSRWLGRLRPASPVTMAPEQVEPQASCSSLAREVELLGEDRVKRQRFFEQWACRDNWLIYQEALPLLMDCAMDDSTDSQQGNTHHSPDYKQSLWEHIQKCVQQGMSPVVLNPSEPPESWRSEPVEMYRWAIAARIAIPHELEALLAFINTSVKSAAPVASKDVQAGAAEDADKSVSDQLAREQVLDAMLCLALRELLNREPVNTDELRDKLLGQLYAASEILFDENEPPLTRPAVSDLLDRSLGKAITR